MQIGEATMRPSILLMLSCVLLMPFLITSAAAATPKTPTTITNANVLNQWLSVIMIAVLASVLLLIFYYVAGYLLNNAQIKTTAINEIQQAFGTAVAVFIIIAALDFVGNAVFSSTNLVPPSTISSICNTLTGANLDFVKNAAPNGYYTPTNTLCNGIISKAKSGTLSVSNSIDYGLGASYIIIANITNQSLTNLNAVYIFESYTGFLTALNPTASVCIPNDICLTEGVPAFYASISYAPFAAYGTLRGVVFPVATQSEMIFYMSLLEEMAILLMLYAWPYILAAGILLRAFTFTRRAGGLIIALVLSALVIFPLIMLFEYSSLTNPHIVPIGANEITVNAISNSIALKGLPIGKTDTPANVIDYSSGAINFFSFPRADYVLNYEGCWPGTSLITREAEIVGGYAIPGYGEFLTLSTALGSFSASVPAVPFTNCNWPNVIHSLFALENLYGIISVIGVIVPVLNLLIVLGSARSLSFLLGGDTNIFGLGRLL